MAIVMPSIIQQLWEDGCTCPAGTLPHEWAILGMHTSYTFRHSLPCPFFPYSQEERKLETASE
jgi:hypothetical protein